VKTLWLDFIKCIIPKSQAFKHFLREPVYDIFVLRFQPKKQQFSVALPTP